MQHRCLSSVGTTILTLVLLAVAIGATAFGQSSTGEILGSVADETGAGIVGAQVNLRNASTGEQRSFTTGETGRYTFTLLSPGNYELEVSAPGFRRHLRSGVTLQVGQRATIDISLQLGAVSESVEVSAETQMLDLADASLGQVIENRKILDLPLNGRNILALTALTTGVTPGTSFGAGLPGGRAALIQAAASNVSISGGMTSMNDVLVDGVPLAICCQNQIAFQPSIDTTQEFRVRANVYDASYGRTGGGVITFASRGGTNEFRGSVYHFLRNDNLDANNFFNNRSGQEKGHFVYNQFGGRFGGPIIRNKLFFFVNYEGIRNVRGAFTTGRTPTADQRQGIFSTAIYDPLTGSAGNNYQRSAFANNRIPSARINPVATNLLPLWPSANAAGVNNFISNAPNTDTDNQYNFRADYDIHQNNRLFARFSTSTNDGRMPDMYGNLASVGWNQEVDNINAVVDDTWTISPSFIVNMRYGFTRQKNFRVAYSIGTDLTDYGWPASYNAGRQESLLPEIRPTGYLGLSRGTLFRRAGQTHGMGVQFSKVAGSHFFKFGVDHRLYQANWVNNGNASGQIPFNTGFTRGADALRGTGGDAFASFLLGYPSGGSISRIEPFSSTSPYWAFFLQDDFRVSNKLTLNLGLRWETELSRDERYDRLSYLDPDVASPIASQTGLPNLKGGLRFLGVDGEHRQQASDLDNWGPRFGFAWQLSDKTVLRGGYGISFLPIQLRFNGSSNQGFSSSTSIVSSLDGGRTPAVSLSNPFSGGFNEPPGASAGLLSSVGEGFSTLLFNENQTGYSQQWSVSIQQELASDVLADFAYSANKGTNLPMPLAINALPSSLLSLEESLLDRVDNPFRPYVSSGTLSAATISRMQSLLPFPQFLGLTSNSSAIGSSSYHSFQAKLNKRFSHGFSVLTAYTFAKIISDVSGWNTAFLDNSPTYQDVYNRNLDRSIDPQDVRHRLALSTVWELPIGKDRQFLNNLHPVANAILGGWQVNGILTLATGQPLVLTNSIATTSGATRPNNIGQSAKLDGKVQDRLNEYFDTSVFTAPGPFQFGNTGRTLPDVRGDGPQNVDLSLFKSFRFTERFNLQFRAEFFNLFNSPQFAEPNGTFGNAQFGVVTNQVNDPRDVQLALRLNF